MESPATFNISQIAMSGCIFSFLVRHCYRYDSCRILVWRTRRPVGTLLFQRLLLLGYTVGISAYIAQGAILAKLKYSNEALDNPEGVLLPQPEDAVQLQAVLYFGAVAFLSEIAVHTCECLCWQFFTTLKLSSGRWLKSHLFKASVVACLGLLAVFLGLAGHFHRNPELGTTVMMLIFSLMLIAQNSYFSFYLFPRMPRLLQQLRKNGLSKDLLQRFCSLNDLNHLRVWSRWGYAVAYLIMSCDGVTGSAVILRHAWAVAFLFYIALFAWGFSNCCTLAIFIPARGSYDDISFNSSQAPEKGLPSSGDSKDSSLGSWTFVSHTTLPGPVASLPPLPSYPSASLRVATTHLSTTPSPPMSPHPFTSTHILRKKSSSTSGFAQSSFSPGGSMASPIRIEDWQATLDKAISTFRTSLDASEEALGSRTSDSPV